MNTADLIVDGAITATQIASRTITAYKIVSKSLTAKEIALNAGINGIVDFKAKLNA